jgi:hypothetical protein
MIIVFLTFFNNYLIPMKTNQTNSFIRLQKSFRYLCVVLLLLSGSQTMAQQFAFPTAQGFGRFATGGRGGKVYAVTNLSDSGIGSFRAALSAFPGEPLTIIFKIGGTINLLSPHYR